MSPLPRWAPWPPPPSLLLLGVAGLMLAPPVAHAVEAVLRGLVGGGGPPGVAPRLTGAAMAVAVGVFVGVEGGAERRGRRRLACAGVLLAAALAVGGGAAPLGALGVVAVGVAGLPRLRGRWLAPLLDQRLAGRPGWCAAWGLLLAAAVVKAALLSTFLADPTWVEASLAPGQPFLVHHSCLAGYVYALRRLQAGAADVYTVALGGGPPVDARPFAPFEVDGFIYPPPFLALVTPALGWDVDFLTIRAVWYALGGVAIAAALGGAGVWIGGRRGAVSLLLAPAVWVTWGYALQLGNVQPLVVAAEVGALALAGVGGGAFAGALLAGAIWTKITPGVVALLLLLQRRWWAAGWTAAWGVGIGLGSLLWGGWATWEVYLTRVVPGLGSAAAWGQLDRDTLTLAANLSPFVVPLKLARLEVDLDPAAVGRWVGHGWTAMTLLLVGVAARRGGGRGEQTITWMALTTVALLRSPFVPPLYLSLVYMILALWAGEARGWRGAAGLVGVALGTLLPALPLPDGPRLVASLAGQAVVFGVLGYALLRRPRGDGEGLNVAGAPAASA